MCAEPLTHERMTGRPPTTSLQVSTDLGATAYAASGELLVSAPYRSSDAMSALGLSTQLVRLDVSRHSPEQAEQCL